MGIWDEGEALASGRCDVLCGVLAGAARVAALGVLELLEPAAGGPHEGLGAGLQARGRLRGSPGVGKVGIETSAFALDVHLVGLGRLAGGLGDSRLGVRGVGPTNWAWHRRRQRLGFRQAEWLDEPSGARLSVLEEDLGVQRRGVGEEAIGREPLL